MAEEVPRWIGLSLLAILVFGLAGVSYRNARAARDRHVETVRYAHQSAVEMLAWVLSGPGEGAGRSHQRALRWFATRRRDDQLRVMDSAGVVLASLDLDEIGRPSPYPPVAEVGMPGLPVGTAPGVAQSRALASDDPDVERWVVTVPLAAPLASGAYPTSPDESGGSEGAYLQSVFTVRTNEDYGETAAGTAVVVLVVVGMFLVVYRLMRRHFRSMSRISENLREARANGLGTGERLEQDLAALRLADAGSEVATQWNSLIDLVDELSAGARRASASAELKDVLERSRRGELADVLNVIPDGVLYVVDRDRMAYSNTMGQRLLELQQEESAGSSSCGTALSELKVGAMGERILSQIRESLGSNGTYNSVSAVVVSEPPDSSGAEGASSSYRVRVLPFNVRKNRGECVVTITDISQQVRADRAAQEFVSQVTHELRTPLTNIRAYAETLSSGVFDDPQVVTECYNVITKETRRLTRLIEDMLSMSQLEVGTIKLQVDDVDLRALLSDSVRDVRGLADEKQIDMQLSLPSKVPVIRGDRDKLAVVVNNLLGNALKYTPSSGTIRVGCQEPGDEILITVKDSGMGIDPADHQRIFEKFQRGSDAEVKGIEGTGIGLTTALEIVRRHGGDIEVMSVKGEGATFIVHLPTT